MGVAAPQVAVSQSDVEFAREVAQEFDQSSVSTPSQNTPSDPRYGWKEWPRCPGCGRRRQTICPSCHTTGNQFPLAEFIPSSKKGAPIQLIADGTADPDEPVLVICELCDTAFAPQFYRRCEACGHDFGGGLVVAEPAATLPEPGTWLIVGIGAILAIVVAVVLLFFAVALHN